MNIRILLICIGCFFLTIAVDAETISRLSAGFELGVFSEENKNNDDLSIISPGITITNYTLFNGIGFFVHGDILFPVSRDYQIYDFSFQLDILFGPAYNIVINSLFAVNLGIGLDILATLCLYEINPIGIGTVKYNKSILNVGLGTDIGIVFNIGSRMYINAGSVFSFSFSNYTSVQSRYGDYSGFTSPYSKFAAKPYIGFGLYLINTTVKS